MTRDQLKRFIKVRNRSDFATNLQFQIDAEYCGFRVGDLGTAKKVEDGVYQWQTPFGLLREAHGHLELVKD